MQERGFVPIISTLLLIVVFTAAATTAGLIISSQFFSRTHPLVDFGDFEATDLGSVTEISFSHQGGEEVPTSEIRVVVFGRNIDEVNRSTTLQIDPGTPTIIRFGDNVEASTPSGEPYYPQGNEIVISVIHIPSGEKLAENRVIVGAI